MGHRSGADGSRPSQPPRRRRLGLGVAVLLALALVAGACSSGRSSDAGDGTTATTKASAADETAFGDLASPCGPGEATGATAQGVTADAVTIGYGDDAGYQPAPGLSHELSDAMKAMIAWCNDQGGINGRKVVGNYYDAKVTEVTNAMTQACEEVFMLVGQGWVFDSGQETTRQGCGLPSVPGYAVSPAFSNAPEHDRPRAQPGRLHADPVRRRLPEALPRGDQEDGPRLRRLPGDEGPEGQGRGDATRRSASSSCRATRSTASRVRATGSRWRRS